MIYGGEGTDVIATPLTNQRATPSRPRTCAIETKKETPSQEYDSNVSVLERLIIETAGSCPVFPSVVAEDIDDVMMTCDDVMNLGEADPEL